MKRVGSLSSKKVLMGVLCCFFLLAGVASANMEVYGECAYTDTNLVCNIYVNTDGETLISGGVALSYDTSKLQDPSTDPVDEKIVRNETEWYFGEPDGTKYSYPAPEIDTTNPASHKVVCMVGKLRESAPAEGVNKTRCLMVKITFDRIPPAGDPGFGPAAATYFGLDLALARSAESFDNFVTTNDPPGVMDDGIDFKHPDSVELPYFPIQVAEFGDANASGGITSRDLTTVRSLIRNGIYVVYADCNASDTITSRDLTCIRSIIRP